MMINKSWCLAIVLMVNTLGAYANNATWDQDILKITQEVQTHPQDLKILVKAVIAYNNYAQMLVKKGNYLKANEYFKKALDIAPEQKVIKNNLSLMYVAWAKSQLEKGNEYKAASLADAALMYNPDSTDAKSLIDSIAVRLKINASSAPASTIPSNIPSAAPASNSMPGNQPSMATNPAAPTAQQMQGAANPMGAAPLPLTTNTPPVDVANPFNASGFTREINNFMHDHGATSVASEQEIQGYFSQINGVPVLKQVNEFMYKYGAKPITEDELHQFGQKYFPDAVKSSNYKK